MAGGGDSLYRPQLQAVQVDGLRLPRYDKAASELLVRQRMPHAPDDDKPMGAALGERHPQLHRHRGEAHGHGAGKRINIDDKRTMCGLAAAMSRVENGVPAVMADVEAGWRLL